MSEEATEDDAHAALVAEDQPVEAVDAVQDEEDTPLPEGGGGDEVAPSSEELQIEGDTEEVGDEAEEDEIYQERNQHELPAAAASVSAPYSIENDPQLDESATYEPTTLVRRLQQWEISRDHLVFADICGLDAGKRHWLHVLETPCESHGGVVLTSAGNTIQVITLQPSPDAVQVRARASNIFSRRYLFGTSGGGIGALAVHPSRRFFAVAEKGVKPVISIYQYPSLRVCRVLKNGTELAYSSVCFSGDGETLASVGCAPDYLLTVWQWRLEQTILRSKAFGQDVFSVRFAPHDSGFLTTSGVGHIRFWKMASTFTGLKLQGDIGKFGKSELSDIEAFCVLPDKKVLSGTERGVLLLWDGNFIKCEVLTSRRHVPHQGSINVVQYEPESQQILTAGSDGVVKFWSFEAIDKADLAPDDSVALVPFKRHVVVHPQVDIRAVVRCGDHRYLVHGHDGSVHLLLLDPHSADGDEVVVDYVANPTGGALGIALSPYEHLAATCGVDGSVRAWDYVHRELLCAASTTVFVQNEADGSPVAWTAAATSIAWVPTASAFIHEPHLAVSRQVVVGFSDGLIRVLLLDVARSTFIRTNVFKPHRGRVDAVHFSPSGEFLATASADATVFLFKVVASAKTSKLAKYPPEYVPLGFQRTANAIRSLAWRADSEALLLTLVDGSVVEYTVPMDGSLEELADRRAQDGAAVDGEEGTDPGASASTETYELHLTSRQFTVLERQRPLTTKELESLAQLNPAISQSQIDDAVRKNFHNVDATISLKVWTACYAPLSTSGAVLLSPVDAPSTLLLCEWTRSTPTKEYANENIGMITTLATSLSGQHILCGLASGKFQLRTSTQPYAFLTGEFHDGSHGPQSGGRTTLALSFDDSFVVSCGADGNVAIARVHTEKLALAARLMDEKHDKLVAEATIVGEQAMEKQKAHLEMLQKAAAAEEAREDGGGGGGGIPSGTNELSALPSFHRAKAYAAYIEAQLASTSAEESVALDEESFGGVARQIVDANSTLGMPLASAPTVDANSPAPVLTMLEVADVTNPQDAYTIEDAKRQSEADARALATRSKQDRTRDVLKKMRTQLQELKTLDASYAPESRLDEDEWEIDLDYGELLVQQGDAACEEVKRELAYAVEKEELLLMKMRETYVNQLAVELLTLHAFESGLSVQSFRTLKMPPLLQKRLHEIHTADAIRGGRQSIIPEFGSKGSALPRRPSVLHIMAKDADLDEGFPLKDEERSMMQRSASMRTGVGGGVIPPGAPMNMTPDASTTPTGSVHGFEARKRLRAERKDKLEKWMAAKPGEDADDPRDLVAIAFAQRNMGDYKLKTAPNYVVPEDQRVNAAKKRRQMALLEEQIYEAKLGFNAKVLELRELKLLLIQEMKSDQQRAAMLKSRLELVGVATVGGVADANSVNLEVDLSEWPEQRERVSDADIELYLKEGVVRPHSVVTTASTSNTPRVGVNAPTANDTSNPTTNNPTPTPALNSGRRRSSVSISAEVTIDGKRVELHDRSLVAVSRRLHGDTTTHTDTMCVRHVVLDDLAPTVGANKKSNADEQRIRVYLLQQELQRLARKQRDEITAFDDAVAHLRREKMRLDVTFKKSELKLFTLLSELTLLEQFESRENLLTSKLEKSKGEKAVIVGEINDIQESLSNKKRDVDEWGKQEKTIQAEFLTLVNGAGSSAAQHPNFAALQKIFKKKIKRPKKKLGKDGKADGVGADVDPSEGDGANHDEEEDDEEDEDEDSDFDGDDDDDDDDEDDVCPPGCDLQLYEKVLALREKRADVDDALSDLSKAMDELKKSNDRQMAKQRQIDKELQATELDIQLFQSEKQMRFNQLDVVIALSKQQIRCLEPSGSGKWVLPEQASSALVFSVQSFEALAERIESLQKENKSLRQQFKDLHKQQNLLAKEKKIQQDKIALIQQKCEQLQLLKFGQLVDIELLDKACDTTKLGELQAKVRSKEMDSERELAKAKQAQQQLKRQILQATERNTALLTRIAQINARQVELERELNEANVSQSVLQDESEQVEREMQERNKLVKVVKLQAREVEALKQEIGLLRGKDGKVYAPRG